MSRPRVHQNSDDSGNINFRVKGQGGNELNCMTTRNEKLEEVMKYYCNWASLDFNSTSFWFGGHLIQGDQTPDELEMEDNDEICATFRSSNQSKRSRPSRGDKDLAIEQMRLELQQANGEIKALWEKQSQLGNELAHVKDELTQLRKGKQVSDEDGIEYTRHARNLVVSQQHEPISVEQSLPIYIKITGQDGTPMFLRVQRNAQLRKVMHAYCDRQGKDFDSMRFSFNGLMIREEQTPNELQMENGDVIDAICCAGGEETSM